MTLSLTEAETDQTLHTHLQKILSTSFYQKMKDFLKEVYNPSDDEIDLAFEMS